jgi:hypothetical protein
MGAGEIANCTFADSIFACIGIGRERREPWVTVIAGGPSTIQLETSIGTD